MTDIRSPQTQSLAPCTLPTCGRGARFLLAMVFAGLALAVYATLDIVGGHFDEYYHVLAAQSLRAGRGLTIASDGHYTRAAEYTAAVAASMTVFGETLWAARVPSMLCMAAAVGLTAAWAARLGGLLAGVLAAGLLLFNPLGLYLGTMCRFYAPQILLVLMAVYITERIIRLRPTRKGRLFRVVTVGGLLFLAARLQPTTIFPASAIFGWLILHEISERGRRRGKAPWRDLSVWITAGVVLLASAAAAMLLREQLASAWAELRGAAAWSQEHQNNLMFYQRYFSRSFGWWWAAFPLMSLIALRRGGISIVLLLSLIAVSFAGQSLGGMKSPRYLAYILPALAVVWGLAGAEMLSHLATWLRSFADQADAPYRRTAHVALTTAAIAGTGWFLITQPPTDVVKDMLDQKRSTGHPYVQNDWGVLNETLNAPAYRDHAIVASAETKALFHLGRADAALGVAQLVDFAEGTADPRTGLPTLATVEGLTHFMSQHSHGIVVAERDHWRQDWGVTHDVADFLETHTHPITLSPAADPAFVAFAWGEANIADTP
ncbi:MAG: glycosyltransferase family 39 protein [Algisphaera sp.]